MSKTKLTSPLVANVPCKVVQETLSNALSFMFQDSKVHCEKHEVGNDLILVMMANGISATLQIREVSQSKKGGLS